MKYKLTSIELANTPTDCLVLPVWVKGKLGSQAMEIDKHTGKSISKIVRSGDISGKIGDSLVLHGLAGIKAKRVLLIGCGEEKSLDAKKYQKICRLCITAISNLNAKDALITLPQLKLSDRDSAWQLSQLGIVTEDTLYKYDRTKSKKNKARSLKTILVAMPKAVTVKAANGALAVGKAVGNGINIAKELGNLPANICTPTYLADQARQLGKRYASLKTEILGEKQMQRLGMGSLLSVSAGSKEEARLIIVRHKGTSKDGSKPHVIVGKGITFDTGGISLKGGAGMDEMKFDMCGAASVLGTMSTIAQLKLPVNVIGIIASAENMPSGKATKPGDIVTSMSGQTIEILNTDAEGRLVLCDALTYAERFNPRSVIDIATLTGAAVATFGSHVTAMLSNHEPLAKKLINVGLTALDPVWQLPLWDEYQPLLNSNFADIANIGGPKAGTITAGCFLSRFTKKYNWAHLDIAGSAWNTGAAKGATGRPVSLLVEYLRQQKP